MSPLLLLLLLLSLLLPDVAHTQTTTPSPSARPVLGASPLIGDPNCAYSVHVSLDGTVYSLVVDSGSANTAVASSACGSGCDGVSPVFSWPSSGGGGSSGTVAYGDGSSIAGPSTTGLFGLPSGNVNVSAGFMAIEQQSDFFNCPTALSQYQGIVGLAYGSLAQNGVQAFMDAAVGAGVPDGFAMQLCDVQDEATGHAGNFWLGGADTSFTTGPFVYAAITQEEYYGVNVSAFLLALLLTLALGPIVLGRRVRDHWTDATGVRCRLVCGLGHDKYPVAAQADLDAVVQAISSSGIISFASGVSQANKDSFWQGNNEISTNYITINPNVNLTVDLQAPNGSTVSVVILTENFIQTTTVGGLTFYMFSGFAVSQSNILGITLLKNMVTFFDRGVNRRIGFAPGTKCASTATAQGIDVIASSFAVPSPFSQSAPLSLVVIFLLAVVLL